MKELRPDGRDQPAFQWFNKETSVEVKPDDEHVFDLDIHLPGTAISIRFTLDPAYLSKEFDDD